MDRRHSFPRLAVAVAAVSSCLALTAQSPSDTPSTKSSNVVTVRGCLNGRVLTVTDRSGLTNDIRSFDLTGSKEMGKLLKEHSGHMEEVTGVLKSGSPGSTPTIKEKTAGKTRAYVGVGHSTPPPDDASRPSIAVRDLTHVAGQCTS